MVKFKTLLIIFITIGYNKVNGQNPSKEEVLANWRFEQVQHLYGNVTPFVVNEPLTSGERGSIEPQPYAYDDSGKDNKLQVRGAKPSTIVFLDNVPELNGMSNTRSLALNRGEYMLSFERPLAYYDLQKSWTIEARFMCNLLGTEQGFLCKEGSRGQLAGDLSISSEYEMIFDYRRLFTGSKFAVFNYATKKMVVLLI